MIDVTCMNESRSHMTLSRAHVSRTHMTLSRTQQDLEAQLEAALAKPHECLMLHIWMSHDLIWFYHELICHELTTDSVKNSMRFRCTVWGCARKKNMNDWCYIYEWVTTSNEWVTNSYDSVTNLGGSGSTAWGCARETTSSRQVCCSVLQCVAVCCSVMQCVLQYVCCSVLQCVAVCCSVLQCVAVCCSVL